MRHHATHVAVLTGVWVLLWGRLSVANVATGILVSAALLVIFPLERRRPGSLVVMRPWAALRLLVHFLVQLLMSNLDMAWQIVRPRPALRTGIVACPLHTRSPGVITMITNVLALSPGLMPVDVITPETDEPSTIYVHVLRLDREQTRQHVARLERLVVDAFGAADEVAACRDAQP
jgi:multicomponent Na+:H+ antiporter subunit E